MCSRGVAVSSPSKQLSNPWTCCGKLTKPRSTIYSPAQYSKCSIRKNGVAWRGVYSPPLVHNASHNLHLNSSHFKKRQKLERCAVVPASFPHKKTIPDLIRCALCSACLTQKDRASTSHVTHTSHSLTAKTLNPAMYVPPARRARLKTTTRLHRTAKILRPAFYVPRVVPKLKNADNSERCAAARAMGVFD
jgi:hypothetical protein